MGGQVTEPNLKSDLKPNHAQKVFGHGLASNHFMKVNLDLKNVCGYCSYAVKIKLLSLLLNNCDAIIIQHYCGVVIVLLLKQSRLLVLQNYFNKVLIYIIWGAKCKISKICKI